MYGLDISSDGRMQGKTCGCSARRLRTKLIRQALAVWVLGRTKESTGKVKGKGLGTAAVQKDTDAKNAMVARLKKDSVSRSRMSRILRKDADYKNKDRVS